MDGAGLEAEMMLGAGATHVVVMSRAHWASVKEMVKVAHGLGGEVMADVLGAEDKAADARAMQDLGVDWIIVHTGFDERRYVPGVSPLDDLDAVRRRRSISRCRRSAGCRSSRRSRPSGAGPGRW